MSKAYYFWGLSGVAACALTGYLMLRGDTVTHARSPAPKPQARTGRETRALTGLTPAHTNTRRELPPTPITVAAADMEIAPDPPTSREALPDAPTEQERMDYADAVFDAETYDRSWATSTLEQLRGHMSDVGMTGTSACREQMCRIEFTDADDVARQRVEDFMRLGKWNVMVTHVTGMDQSTRVKLFLTPPGVDVPEPDHVAPEP
jgi:hypothetical protein